MPPTLSPSPSSISMTFRRQYVLPAPGRPVMPILSASPMPPTRRHKYALLYKNTLRIRRPESAPLDRPTASGRAASPQLAPATKDIKRHASGASVHRLKLVLLIVGIVIATVGLLGALYGILAAGTAQTEYNLFCPGGQMPPQFCASLLSSVSSYHALTVGMAIFGVVGLVLTIAALAMKGPLFAAAAPTFAPSTTMSTMFRIFTNFSSNDTPCVRHISASRALYPRSFSSSRSVWTALRIVILARCFFANRIAYPVAYDTCHSGAFRTRMRSSFGFIPADLKTTTSQGASWTKRSTFAPRIRPLRQPPFQPRTSRSASPSRMLSMIASKTLWLTSTRAVAYAPSSSACRRNFPSCHRTSPT